MNVSLLHRTAQYTVCLCVCVFCTGHPNNRGSIVHLEYTGSKQSGSADDSGDELLDLFMVGKGIVYDTGGHDLKVGGIMKTMHRDKCGAAAVAGFFKVLSLLRPHRLNVSAAAGGGGVRSMGQ